MASGLAFSSLPRDRGSLGPIEGLAPLGTHQGLLPGSSPLGQKEGGDEGVGRSWLFQLLSLLGMEFTFYAYCNSGLHVGVIPPCLGVGYESKTSLNLGL